MESEPELVGLGPGSEWDTDLSRVRLGYDGYDMVRIRVRYERMGDTETVGDISPDL